MWYGRPRHQTDYSLVWGILALVVVGAVLWGLTRDDRPKPTTAEPGATTTTAAVVPAEQPAPRVPDHRTDCAAIQGTDYLSEAERAWFTANCTNAGSRQILLPLPVGLTVAQVVRIIDGDTIDVLIDGVTSRVRYFGLDTPERGQACFTEATERNRALVGGKTVLLVPDVRNVDPYGRLLRYILLPDGTFVDATLVAEGYGRAWTRDGAYRSRIIALQADADRFNRGCLWR